MLPPTLNWNDDSIHSVSKGDYHILYMLLILDYLPHTCSLAYYLWIIVCVRHRFSFLSVLPATEWSSKALGVRRPRDIHIYLLWNVRHYVYIDIQMALGFSWVRFSPRSVMWWCHKSRRLQQQKRNTRRKSPLIAFASFRWNFGRIIYLWRPRTFFFLIIIFLY